MYSISKTVQIGDMISLRGGKLVRCGRGMKPFGAYQFQEHCVTLTLDGTRHVCNIPEGFRLIGHASVRSKYG